MTEKKSTREKQRFTKSLYIWAAQNPRPMPWRGEKNPYLIWLSEIILQQTRVKQGWSYFKKFKTRFPTVHELAAASEDEVMKLWQGLGYYSRARHLHITAKYIAEQRHGVFPDSFDAIKKLKGVGDYTAAAIASFAYDLPHAVIDGNVYRVYARYFGISTPVDTAVGKKKFADIADKMLDKCHPAKFNQAVMDFGAMQCIPLRPDCGNCPMQEQCRAFQKSQIELLPARSKKIQKRTRYFHYMVLRTPEKTAIRKRTAKDIWQNLYEFPMVEMDSPKPNPEALKISEWSASLPADKYPNLLKVSPIYRQTLTHQKIVARFYEFEIPDKADLFLNLMMVKIKKLDNFAFPKIIDLYLQEKKLTLELLQSN